MSLRVIVDDADQLATGVWNIRLAPSEIQRLGSARNSVGHRSVLLIDEPTFDEGSKEFRFKASGVRVLNLGTSSETVAIAASLDKLEDVFSDSEAQYRTTEPYGTGDREFLNLIDRRLTGQPLQAAKQLLRAVRSAVAGDLQRGKRLNFKNTPDNFWYVVVQPTAQSLSVTVRGQPGRFGAPSKLDLKGDRPGYTRFKINRLEQIDEALQVIWKSRRRDG